MARSSLHELPAAVLEAVNAAIGAGATIDEVVQLIRDRGDDKSRSAVGRYAKGFQAMVAEQRKLRTFAEAFGREFSDSTSEQRMMTQVMTSVVTRALIPLAEGGEVDLEPQDLNFLASAVKHTAGAAKLDVDRDAKIREEAAKRAREQAARDVVASERAAGASEETLARIWKALGGSQ